MANVEFTKEEKAGFFDKIAECFYHNNFGQLSKSEMDLMMFHFYLEKLISDNVNPDGTIDYRKCSDYKISKDLGITQQRVRNLKVKNQLTYPMEYDWKRALATLTENARYDKSTGKVVLNIPDPNLYLEIQNFIEDQGAYIEKQLNSKVLQIRAEYYIELIINLEPENSKKKIIKSLKTQFKESGKDDSAFDEAHIGKTLIQGALDITTIAANIRTVVSPENYLGVALIKLLEKYVSTQIID
jgi:hypothetical protein